MEININRIIMLGIMPPGEMFMDGVKDTSDLYLEIPEENIESFVEALSNSIC